MSDSEFAFVFEGDGRKLVEPLDEWHMPGMPTAVTRAQARGIAERYEKTGVSVHSELAQTLWVIIAWGMYKGEGMVIKQHPGGYVASKTH